MQQNKDNFFRNFTENEFNAPLSYSAPGVGPEKKTSAPGVVTVENTVLVKYHFSFQDLHAVAIDLHS